MLKRMRPFSKKLMVCIGLILLVLLLFNLFFKKPSAPSFITATAKLEDLEETVLASGTLQALQQINVGAQVSGQLKTLKVSLGQRITKGQLIAEIDDTTQRNALRDALANLKTRRAEQRAKLAKQKQENQAFVRQKRLLAHDASSRAKYEEAETALVMTHAEIEALEAQMAQAEIKVDIAKADLNYTRIHSPIDGVVIAVIVKEGQTISAMQSAPTIVKIAQLDTITVKAQISEADVTRVHPGQKVYFTLLGSSEPRYYSTLRAIEPAIDAVQLENSSSAVTSSPSSAIYYNGLFEVPNPDHKLRISMTAQVSMVLSEAKQVVTIPASVLGPPQANGHYQLKVVGANGEVQSRLVKVGVNNKVSAQILEGLQPNEKVVIAGAPTDKMSVSVGMGS